MTDLTIGGLSPEDAEKAIYQHILSRNPEHDFEPTLDRVSEVCDLLGNPQSAFKVVHLTGTNGKTSTARMVESLVRAHGLRTGLFTSPHLSSVRERIQIDGEPISRADFVQVWQDVAPLIDLVDQRSAAQGGPRMSFFEVLTVLAYAAFADAPVDVAVIEVGMGGTWDATNVADATVAVIGPVAMDHERWLGSSLADIAAEKAGIIKPGCDLILAEQSPAAAEVIDAAVSPARSVLREGTDVEVMERQVAVGGQMVTLRTAAAVYEGIFVPLFGAHQARNASLALAAVEALMADGGAPSSLDPNVVEQGFAQVTSPGRLEIVRTSPTVLVDAAHNPHGVDALADAIEESFTFEHLAGVVGILEDKDAEGILAGLEGLLDSVVITQSASPRAIPADELAVLAVSYFGEDRVVVEPHLPSAIDAAVQRAESEADMGAGVLVVGSITLVAEARLLFRVDNPRIPGVGR